MLLHASGQHPQGSYKLVRTAYRDFFQWAEDEELVERSPAKRMPKSRPQQTKVYDIFTPVEQAQLVRAADRMPLPWVQRLRVLAFVDLGIRSEEARLMQPRDVDLASRTVVVRGKGDKERVVPFSEDFFRAFVGFRNRPIPNVRMADAHGKFREARAPLDDDYLFFPLGFVKASGVVTWTDPFRPLASRAMRSWWSKLIETSGVTYRSLHMNRHTLGTNLSDAGEGIETIGEWLGHASADTTKVYVHNSRSRLRRGRGALDDWRKAQGE
jgi:integrase/recombinase XerC